MANWLAAILQSRWVFPRFGDVSQGPVECVRTLTRSFRSVSIVGNPESGDELSTLIKHLSMSTGEKFAPSLLYCFVTRFEDGALLFFLRTC